jgi:hypothetical protein
MKLLLASLIALVVLPLCPSASQVDDNWPSLSYLRNDYKVVSVVAHIRIDQAVITGRVGGYENWKVTGVIIESFKGRLKKDNSITYFQGAEAGLKREYSMKKKLSFFLPNVSQSLPRSITRC